MFDKIHPTAGLVTTAVLFGVIPIVSKLSSLDEASLSFWRVFLTSLCLLIFLKLTSFNYKLPLRNIKVILFGVFHAITILLGFWAIKLIPMYLAVFLLYLGMIYLIPLSSIFLKEKLTKRNFMATIIAIIGLIFIFYRKDFVLTKGILVGFLSGISMTIVFFLSKIIEEDINRTSLTFYQNVIALPILLPLAFNKPFIFEIKEISYLLILSVLCTAFATLLLWHATIKVDAYKTGIILLLSVVIPFIAGIFLFNEIPLLRESIGSGLIFIAFILSV